MRYCCVSFVTWGIGRQLPAATYAISYAQSNPNTCSYATACAKSNPITITLTYTRNAVDSI